jgi:hypothetical protein
VKSKDQQQAEWQQPKLPQKGLEAKQADTQGAPVQKDRGSENMVGGHGTFEMEIVRVAWVLGDVRGEGDVSLLITLKRFAAIEQN